MSIAEIKERSRRRLHSYMSAAVQWSDGESTLPLAPDKAALSARWHNKLVRQSEIGDGVDILEGLDRLVFQQDQLAALGIVLRKGHTILFPEYGRTFELDMPEPGDGPLNVYWRVTRP